MRFAGISILVGAAFFAASASASDADVLRQFGMHGRIAVDCAARPSGTNPHLIFAVSAQGAVTRTLEMADPDLDATLSIRNLWLVAPDRLQFQETGRQGQLMSITVARIGGKFRSWRSERGDGQVLIADGKFVSSGASTVAFSFCGR